MKLLQVIASLLALGSISGVALSQPPVSSEIVAMVEAYAKSTLVERGYWSEQSERDRLFDEGKIDEAMAYREPGEHLDELIESATNATVGRRRQRKDTDDIYDLANDSDQWNFRNNTEKQRKILELQIRKQLLPRRTEAWHEPEMIPFRFSQLQEGAVVTMSTIKGFEGMEFEERLNDQTIHVSAKTLARGSTSNFDTNRYAIHGIPAAIAESLEVGRDTGFLVLIHGVDKYQSVTGERTVVHLDYVPDELLQSIFSKLVPEVHRKAKVDKPHAESRKWASIDGKYEVEAYAKSVTKNDITLHKTDGKEITVPLSKLSRKDVEWAKAFEAALGPLEAPPQSNNSSDSGYGYGLQLDN